MYNKNVKVFLVERNYLSMRNKVNFRLGITIKVISLLLLLFGFSVVFVIFFEDAEKKISVASVICLFILLLVGSIVYLYKRFLQPLDALLKALDRVDFNSGLVDCTYVDKLKEQGSGEMRFLTSKFKYLIDVIATRINLYNDETSKSEHDELTGCYNRVHLNRVKTWYEMQMNTIVIFIDVNNLKKMNDIFGHEAGDALLKNAANSLKFWNNYGDVYRLGGDEFMIVLVNLPYVQCMQILNRWYPTVGILNRVEDGFKCVLSYGVAEGRQGCSFDALEKQADERMYDMKVAIKKKFGEPMR